MTLTRTRFDLGRMKADMFSAMWRTSSPMYGPQRVPPAAELEQALKMLREAIRELCIPDLKRASVAHRAERDGELEQIAECFLLQGREAVCDFVRQHRTLIPVIVETHKKFVEYFDIDSRLHARLEIFVDPEDGYSTPKLFAFVRTALPFSDASQRLDRLHEEWWFDQADETARLMNIGVEYADATV